ncbi:helix-turn-helix domain-containing protein [Streptomyces sp. NPDC059819]|uniref:helix-turn-helix domain-containing protein n=1 Tax=Streptomyces sp. NPDC059819 TaxID=3346963 RepID=UPI003651C1EE
MDFGLLLHLLLRKTGLRQSEMAPLVGLGAPDLSRLLSGSRRLTHIDKIAALAEALGIPDELWPLRRPGTARLPGIPTEPPEAWESAPDIGRRIGIAHTSNTSSDALDMFSTEVQYVVDHYESDGAHGQLRLAERAVRLRHTLQDLLAGQQPPSHRAELFALAARTSALLGYMAVNRGQHTTADAYSDEAIAFARDIEDVATTMWACGTKSLNAYYEGDLARAASCAIAGIDLAPEHPQAIRLLANGLARALGKRGDRAGAERAVGRAEELSDRHGMPTGLTPCISLEPYGLARTLANAATVHVALGNTAAVLDYAGLIGEQILTGESAWSQALVQLDVATAQTTGSQADIEHAMLLGRQVLEAHTEGPLILSVVQRAQDLHRIAAPWRDLPAVRDYRDALEQWAGTPRVRRLATSATMHRPALTSAKDIAHGHSGAASPLFPARSTRRP